MRIPNVVLRGLAAIAITATVTFGLTAGTAAAATPAQVSMADGQLAVASAAAPRFALSHTFTKEETAFLFDAAKAGGVAAITAGCMALVPPPGNLVCAPAATFVVALVGSVLDPKGRCLKLWANTDVFPPAGAEYVTC